MPNENETSNSMVLNQINSIAARVLEEVSTEIGRLMLKQILGRGHHGESTLFRLAHRSAYRVFLYRFAKEFKIQTFVELGTGPGWTARLVSFASPDIKVITIDALENPCGTVLDACENVTRIIGDSQNADTRAMALEELDERTIGVLFIDAEHTPSAVEREIVLWEPFVTRGGVIFFDDVRSNHKRALRQWWIEFIRANKRAFELHALHTLRGFGGVLVE